MEPDPVDPNEAWPSLDLVFDAVRVQVDDQRGLIAALDNKAGFSLGAASILTGGIGTLAASLAALSSNRTASMKYLRLGLFDVSASQLIVITILLTFLAYLFVVYTAYQAYKLRRYASGPDVTALATKYVYEAPSETKGAMISSMVRGYQENQKVIAKKTTWVNWTIRAIAVEAGGALIIGALQIWTI